MPAAYQFGPDIPGSGRKPGCTGKAAYDSRADAIRTARYRGTKGKPYECRWCGAWHNTNMGRTEGRKAANRALMAQIQADVACQC